MWRFSSSEWQALVSSASFSFETEFEEDVVHLALLHSELTSNKSRQILDGSAAELRREYAVLRRATGCGAAKTYVAKRLSNEERTFQGCIRL